MDLINTIIVVCLGLMCIAYWRNTVLELRKLNKQFEKFYRWIYYETPLSTSKKEEPKEKEDDEKTENKKKDREINPKLKDFITKGKLW